MGYTGENYENSLDIKEIAKKIRTQLKREFPDCKFSVRIERYSGGCSLNISLMSAPFYAGVGYHQVNHYWLRRNIDEALGMTSVINNGKDISMDAAKVLLRASEIANSYNYDRSEIQSDYFDTNFYLHVEIGKWDKPFSTPEVVRVV